MTQEADHQRRRLAMIWARERQRLTRFARSRLGAAPDDAEDVVADVVIKLVERADVLGQVDDLAAYLFRAVGHALTDLFRRRRILEPVAEDHPDPAPTPEGAAEMAQMRQRLDSALSRLPAAERRVWLAVEVEGHTFRQLAEQWQEPIGTLLSRKARATQTLRRLLMEYSSPQG